MQKADRVAVFLMEIVRLFYPKMKGKNWDHFVDFISERYGKDDEFSKLVTEAVIFS